jgi:hypothetical protein
MLQKNGMIISEKVNCVHNLMIVGPKIEAASINYCRGNFNAFRRISMGFPRGGFSSSATKHGNTIVPGVRMRCVW